MGIGVDRDLQDELHELLEDMHCLTEGIDDIVWQTAESVVTNRVAMITVLFIGNNISTYKVTVFCPNKQASPPFFESWGIKVQIQQTLSA